MDTIDAILSAFLGISLAVNVIFIPRFMQTKKKLSATKKGDLFLSSDGEMWSEFYVGFEELAKDSSVLMGVHYIEMKTK